VLCVDQTLRLDPTEGVSSGKPNYPLKDDARKSHSGWNFGAQLKRVSLDARGFGAEDETCHGPPGNADRTPHAKSSPPSCAPISEATNTANTSAKGTTSA
jgi:hypothetical protein